MSHDQASVQIDDLSLRVPGLASEHARVLGERVAMLVAEKLSRSGATLELGALDLRLRVAPTELTADRLADVVTRAALRGAR